jgi:hypothetical protein
MSFMATHSGLSVKRFKLVRRDAKPSATHGVAKRYLPRKLQNPTKVCE